METETFAFIIPHFCEYRTDTEYLEAAVNSVRRQSDKNWRIYIIDDCSVSKFSEKLYKDYSEDPKISVLRSNLRVGPGGARNIGISRAVEEGSPFVLFLDSDDLASPERLRKVRTAASEDGVTFIYNKFSPVDGSGEIIPTEEITPSIQNILWTQENSPVHGENAWLRIALLNGYSNLTSATALASHVALKFKFPLEDISEDFHTWLRIASFQKQLFFIPEVLSYYRISDSEAGSASRIRVGDNFYFQKARVDSAALEVVLPESSFDDDTKGNIRSAFRARLAIELSSEQENGLSNWLLSLSKDEIPNQKEFSRESVSKIKEASTTDLLKAKPYSFQELQSALIYCFRFIPFYREHWDSTEDLIKVLIDQEKFSNLPFTEKLHVSQRTVDLCPDNLKNISFFRHRTSGTTGEPVTALVDHYEWQRNLIGLFRQLTSLDFDVDDEWSFLQVTAYLAATDVKITSYLPNNPIWRKLNVPLTSEVVPKLEKIAILYKLLERENLVLNGMPSVLLNCGKLLKDYFPDFNAPKIILTSGEGLDDKMREEISGLFNASVYSTYASGESGCIGYECKEADGFHLENSRLKVELVKSEENICEVVTTSIFNKSMPLIRYRTGDFAELILEPCVCGDERPKIRNIIGRSHQHYYEQLRRSFPNH